MMDDAILVDLTGAVVAAGTVALEGIKFPKAILWSARTFVFECLQQGSARYVEVTPVTLT